MSTTSKEPISIAISAEAEALLQPILDMFRTKRWSAQREKPICLVCSRVDFSGHLVEAHALHAKEDYSVRIWMPHHYVLLAVDFSPENRPGFHSL